MAIQLKRTGTTPTAEQLSSLADGQPLVNLETGDMYIGGCCDGRPVNASNILNGSGQDSLMQYGGTQKASAGSPAYDRVGNSADGKYAVAIGRYVHSDVRNAITLGYTSVNKSEYGTVIGRGNYSEGANSVVIGKYNNNIGADNYIIGTFNNLENVSGCYLFGTGLTAIQGNNFVIGNNNDSSHNNGHDIFQIGDGWGSGAAETKDEKFNLVTVLKRVRDAEGQYSYGGYMEIAIQGNTPNSVIKKSTMDTAISDVESKVNEVEEDLSTQLQEVDDKVEQHNNDYTEFIQSYLQTVYPIGSIYMSVLDTDPTTLFGGTWERWGAGRVPVGVNTEDEDFNEVEKEGGAKDTVANHTHTVSSHSHSVDITTSKDGNHYHAAGGTNDYYVMTRDGGSNGDPSSLQTSGTGTGGEAVWKYDGYSQTEYAGNHTHTVDGYTGYAGSGSTGQATNSKDNGNLQPYITCYMWKRTA